MWDLVSTPGWWVPSDIEPSVDRTPGHQTVRDSQKWGRFPVEVVEIRPRTYAAFRWASQFPGEELTPGRTTLVEFFVDRAGQDRGVTVTVVESGFAGLAGPEEVRQAGLRDNTGGWPLELGSLKDRSEQPSPA